MIVTSARIGAALLAAACSAAQAVDLVSHQGFEVCWNAAASKAQFLSAVRDSVDGTLGCVAPQSGSEPPLTYTSCDVPNGCGPGIAGCPVTLQAGNFVGDFASGHFSAPGTAGAISVPIVTNLFGSCTLSLSGITLGYTLDYLMQIDGTDGVYSADLLAPDVDIVTYTASNNCNALISGLIDSYVPEALASAEAGTSQAIEPALRADTLEISVCPLSTP